MKCFNWLPFLDIMEFTDNRIDNDKYLFLPFFYFFLMFNIECWWNKK